MLKILNKVKEAQIYLYNACDLKISKFIPEDENSAYYGHNCFINNMSTKFRIAKETPTKIGRFVTMWKRGADGIIAPYDEADAIDFIIVVTVSDKKIGQFVFPKSILLKKDIFSINNKGGKRAIRVYTPWDNTTNIQAIRTQKWQEEYFIDLSLENSENIQKMKKLFKLNLIS